MIGIAKHSNRARARGCARRGAIEIGVRLDDEMFGEIKARATANKTSVSEEVRTLIQWGLDSAAEAS